MPPVVKLDRGLRVRISKAIDNFSLAIEQMGRLGLNCR
jgi:hypothetical protein